MDTKIDRIKYSLVVPIYRDAALADAFCAEIQRTFEKRIDKKSLADDLEVVFVDDGSGGDSVDQLKKVAHEYPFAKVVGLSRNFGHHIAVTAGYAFASGQYVGSLNVDQEDPPDQILLLLDVLEAGECDFARGLYKSRDTRLSSRVSSWAFTQVMNKLTGFKTPTRAATLRVMNRAFVDAYNSFEERARFYPGLEEWLGFKHRYVEIRHQTRKEGRSTYNFRRRWSLAMDALLSFSDFPLRMAVRLGILVSIAGFLSAIALVIEKLVRVAIVPGWTSSLAATVTLGGVQILITGIASLYVGRILREVQRRPLFLVRDKIGFDRAESPKRLNSPAALAPNGGGHDKIAVEATAEMK